MTNSPQQRQHIRDRIKAQRAALSSTQLLQAGEALFENCLPLLSNASSVAGYKAIRGEMPVDLLLADCQRRQITTLLPIMLDEGHLLFAPFDESTPFKQKQFGIAEPDIPAADFVQPMHIDAVLVPLVAFDKTLNRMGMGGGFYDRSFADRKQQNAPPLLIGVAHAFQQVESVLADWWDVPLDYVVTDEGVFSRSA
jgi:5-formyltetrahydrofolate cyclo-ligase